VLCGVVSSVNPELDTVVLVEFPFTLNRHEFEFFRPDTLDDRLFARIYSQVVLFGMDGLPIDSAKTYFSATVSDSIEAATDGIKLFNRMGLLVKPGIYTARVTVIDVSSKKKGEFFFDRILVGSPNKDALVISGVCLAYDITYVGDNSVSGASRTVKSGFDVLYNPLRIYGIEDTTIYLYAELYNLDYEADRSTDYTLTYAVLDSEGNWLRELGTRTRQKAGTTAVVVESFDIGGWPSDIYSLRIAASDRFSGKVDTQMVAFRIISPADLIAVRETEKPVDDGYDTLSLEVKQQIVFHLLNPVERKFLKTLNDTGKESYLEQYWREHDSNPETEIIENRLDMLEDYIHCNRFFSTSLEKNDGWQTDRGRVYMTYGPWEDRDDVQTPQAMSAPFIIWYYHSMQEGLVFVFEDLHGIQDYTLVHSNADGERFDEQWGEHSKRGLIELY